MHKKIKLIKPRATFLNKLLLIKSKKSGRMVNNKEKRLQAKTRRELLEDLYR